MEVSKLMKKTLSELMKKGKRIDKRKLDEFRNINIKLNISKNAEGSALVELGKTKVVAGVKINLLEPFPDTPEEGVLIVNAEFLPLAYGEFEPGPPGVEAIEMARVIDRGIRESGFIDFKKLCLEKGKKVYGIFIDIYVLNHDGNLIDAGFLASIYALINAKLPKIEKIGDDYKIVYKEWTNRGLPLNELPFMCTVYKLGDSLFIDASLTEEKAIDAKISVSYTLKPKPQIHAIQKFGNGTFTLEELEKVLDLSKRSCEFIRENFLSKVKVK